MKLYFYKCKNGNYGDDLNAWLWKRLLPQAFSSDENSLFCGIGTILNQDIPSTPERKVVFSSGFGYGRPPEGFGDKNWNIVSVRGPLSAALLNLSPDLAVTDGAIFLASLPEFSPMPPEQRQGIAFMPHHENALIYGQWQKACREAGITFIDPRGDSIQATETIRKSRLVIAEAMHAAIAADTLRVPWIPVFASRNINHFKWLDWTLSLGLPYKPVRLPPSTVWEALQNLKMNILSEGDLFLHLSPEEALAQQCERLKQPTDAEWTPKKKLVEAIDKRLEKFIKRPVIRSMVRAVDRQLLRKSVRALGKAVRESPSFLSDEMIYFKKLEQMNTRLETVRKLAE